MKIKSQKIGIPKDGTPKEILLKDTPIVLNVHCWSAAPVPFNYDRYSWRAEVRVKGGKLLPITDGHQVMAPQEGYLDVIKIEMPADLEKHWHRSSAPSLPSLWVRLNDGTYAKLEVKVITGRNHAVLAYGLLNLDGTNSFEK